MPMPPRPMTSRISNSPNRPSASGYSQGSRKSTTKSAAKDSSQLFASPKLRASADEGGLDRGPFDMLAGSALALRHDSTSDHQGASPANDSSACRQLEQWARCSATSSCSGSGNWSANS